MKHRTIPLLLMALIAIGVAGCATSARQNRGAAVNRPRSFALAVTVNGALQPTPEQWATIQANFAKMLAARGWVLVTDLALADHILRVDFTPNPDNPESSGHARILGIRANPNTMVARRGTGPLPGAFGYYSTGMGMGWPYNSSFYTNSYYGYGDFYNNGYSSGWTTVTTPVATTPTPPPSHPPYRHSPGNRDDCPPEHVLRPMPVFSSNPSLASNPVYDHPRPPPSDYRPSSSDRSHASRSDRSDRSYSSYSRNDSSYSSYSGSNYSNSSSYSSSDYSSSASSMSSAASSSSSAASAAAAASVSSSAASDPVTVNSK